MMADYSCACPGPFGTARYTVADAVRMNFYCQRCKSQIIQLDSFVVTKFDEDDVDDVQVAPGANSNSDKIQAILDRENEAKKNRDVWEIDVKSNVVEDLKKASDEMFSNEELPRPNEENVRNLDLMFGQPPKEYDVVIRYAHGVAYKFDWDDFDEPTEDVIRQFQRFTNSWTQRKNYALVLKARGRWWLLNAELVAGIDYKD